MLGNKKGRTCESDITVYDSTGIALQDLMISNLAIKMAKEKNIGEEILL